MLRTGSTVHFRGWGMHPRIPSTKLILLLEIIRKVHLTLPQWWQDFFKMEEIQETTNQHYCYWHPETLKCSHLHSEKKKMPGVPSAKGRQIGNHLQVTPLEGNQWLRLKRAPQILFGSISKMDSQRATVDPQGTKLRISKEWYLIILPIFLNLRRLFFIIV